MFLLTVFVLGDALQRDAKEGGVGVVVPDQQLRPSGDVHAGPVEYTRPGRGAAQSTHTLNMSGIHVKCRCFPLVFHL